MEEQNGSSDFGALFEAHKNLKTTIRTGEKVSGNVIMVGKSTVFVDLGARTDGIIDILDFADGKGGFDVKVGDKVEAYCMGWSNEGIKLQMKMSGDQVDSSISDAYTAKMPLEGKVLNERKGGYTIQVGTTEAFCPFSGIDVRGVKKDPAEYIGKKFLFRVTEYSEEDHNVVLSRRPILDAEMEKDREKLKETLQEGDELEGTVTKIMPFGAFVNIGGVEGMVHISEISWNRGIDVNEYLKEGQIVPVKVLSVEWGEGDKRDRIALSIKQAEEDPWDAIPTRYPEGTKMKGRVTNIADFGCFIELEPGIEGLAHISQLGTDKHINHPSEVVKEGDEVDITVLAVEKERRRISLCIGEPKKNEKPVELNPEQEKQVITSAVAGQTLEGEVEQQKIYGLFIKLPNGQTGLLHVSQIDGDQDRMSPRQLYKKYPLHSKIKVVIREVNGDRISLTLPEMLEKEMAEERNEPLDVKDKAGKTFGSFGDLLDNLKL